MTKYQNLFLIALFSFAGIFFTSCEKEGTNELIDETIENVITGRDYTNGVQSGDSTDCFEIVFPIQINLPGTGVVSVDGYLDLATQVGAWYDANPNSPDEPSPVFPIDVILEDGTQESLADEAAFEALLINCFGEDWDEDCEDICDDDEYDDDDEEDDDEEDEDDDYDCDEDFEDEFCLEIVYPVSLVLPDGTNATANNDDELQQIIEDFYDSNPDYEDDEFELVFPIDVILPDGTTQTVNNEDELWGLADMHCEYEDDDDYEECFEINFPVTLVFSDGSTVLVNNEDEAEDAEDAFEDANPDLDDEYTFEFPINVTLDDGTVQTLNNDAELEGLEDSCD